MILTMSKLSRFFSSLYYFFDESIWNYRFFFLDPHKFILFLLHSHPIERSISEKKNILFKLRNIPK